MAELTNSRAVMNAAAKAVAVSRPVVKIVDILGSLYVREPDDRARASFNAGSVPNWNYRLFSMKVVCITRNLGVQDTESWDFSPSET